MGGEKWELEDLEGGGGISASVPLFSHELDFCMVNKNEEVWKVQ